MLKSRENVIGAWAFLIGVVLAIIIGISASRLIPIDVIGKHGGWIYGLLLIIGIFIGFVNINEKDAQTFMIAGAVIVIISNYGIVGVKGTLIGAGLGNTILAVFGALIALFTPATIIVALKTVFSLARV